ncbi:MAG TPA: hypothetical protein VFR87_09725 [Nocardioidaceae bacterium]|nr:hypothetical protein [Nocardioidaceae bacterium]
MTEYAHHVAFTLAVEQVRTRSAELAQRAAWAEEAAERAGRRRKAAVLGVRRAPRTA